MRNRTSILQISLRGLGDQFSRDNTITVSIVIQLDDKVRQKNIICYFVRISLDCRSGLCLSLVASAAILLHSLSVSQIIILQI